MDTRNPAGGPAPRETLGTSTTVPPVLTAAGPRHAVLDLSGLTGSQHRGSACAFCDRPVSNDNAVDLGERRDADGVRIFPRAHPECVEAER
ncbi:hypothetical protein [Streptomyces sp. 8L]|uniref:hypothetical protein n=1 Tax=Streptomyces sp. 8L TaxID=2877242 RepID=UPI001CD662D9|nr:hypothetical protein [Streptomyces sp. 8L]MCA1223291.1 hypothetical protein [Streptomyces sp. 8L]